MSTIIPERVLLARQGKNRTVICQMPSGWAVLSDNQVTRGYCILLSDPAAGSLNELEESARLAFLTDMVRVGDALLKVTGAARVNYEILGNTDHFLHAHIIPRYETEPDARKRMPIWFYDFNSSPKFDVQRDCELMEQIRQALQHP